MRRAERKWKLGTAKNTVRSSLELVDCNCLRGWNRLPLGPRHRRRLSRNAHRRSLPKNLGDCEPEGWADCLLWRRSSLLGVSDRGVRSAGISTMMMTTVLVLWRAVLAGADESLPHSRRPSPCRVHHCPPSQNAQGDISSAPPFFIFNYSLLASLSDQWPLAC